GGRPHGALVEARLVAEPERRIPRLELLRALEEADDLAILGIGGHPIPGPRREIGRAGRHDRVQPFGHGPIRFLHRGDPREPIAFPVGPALARTRFRLQLLGTSLQRGPFVGRESLVPLTSRARAVGGVLSVLASAHTYLLHTWPRPKGWMRLPLSVMMSSRSSRAPRRSPPPPSPCSSMHAH